MKLTRKAFLRGLGGLAAAGDVALSRSLAGIVKGRDPLTLHDVRSGGERRTSSWTRRSMTADQPGLGLDIDPAFLKTLQPISI